MKRFLLLFSAYRDLLVQVESADSRLATAEARIAELETELRSVNAAHKQDLRNTVDSYSRQAIGRHVFARAEAPVAAPPSHPPTTGRKLARDVASQRTQESKEKFLGMIQSEIKSESLQ